MRTWGLDVVVVVLVSACRTPVDELDGAFYSWDGRTVHCSVEIDDRSKIPVEQILAGMDHAKLTGEVLELLAHKPGVTVSLGRLEHVLAGAVDRGLPFLTATDLVRGTPTAGVALMFDDWHVSAWVDTMPLLAKYGARATFYLARYARLSATEREQLATLAVAGHDIEAHGTLHLRGPHFVEDHGLRAYLDDEVVASIDVLERDGYEVLSYAYPFGAHTSEMDRAILETGRVQFVRSLAKTNELRANPCPY